MMATVNELTAKFAASVTKPIDTLKPDKVYSLVHVWQLSVKKGQVAPGFTKKDLGQLKMLIQKWPEGHAPEILAFVLSHWYEMTEAVETETTKYNSPSCPDLGYLLKYKHIAVNLWLKSKLKAKVTKVTAPPVAKPVQSVAQKPAPSVLPDTTPATWEEMQAIDAELLKDAS